MLQLLSEEMNVDYKRQYKKLVYNKLAYNF